MLLVEETVLPKVVILVAVESIVMAIKVDSYVIIEKIYILREQFCKD